MGQEYVKTLGLPDNPAYGFYVVDRNRLCRAGTINLEAVEERSLEDLGVYDCLGHMT